MVSNFDVWDAISKLLGKDFGNCRKVTLELTTDGQPLLITEELVQSIQEMYETKQPPKWRVVTSEAIVSDGEAERSR